MGIARLRIAEIRKGWDLEIRNRGKQRNKAESSPKEGKTLAAFLQESRAREALCRARDLGSILNLQESLKSEGMIAGSDYSYPLECNHDFETSLILLPITIAKPPLLMKKLLGFRKDLDLSIEAHIRSRSSPYRIHSPAEHPLILAFGNNLH